MHKMKSLMQVSVRVEKSVSACASGNIMHMPSNMTGMCMVQTTDKVDIRIAH